jgi:hypothetical protein
LLLFGLARTADCDNAEDGMTLAFIRVLALRGEVEKGFEFQLRKSPNCARREPLSFFSLHY